MNGPSVVEDVFLAVLEKGTPGERAAFLDAACKDDSDLRRRVERLLEAHPKACGFLDSPARPAGEETAGCFPTGNQVGTVIAGRYKLLEQIGEGGMGTVWVAEQTQPIRRKVALKLIKAGMDSKTVLSRFEAERQALALMDHPNIAKVLDGGATESGRPYFVMEYVKGVPLSRYCDDARLSVAQRLALFVPVCQAVQHAHQKGIIHRDLKPSNILVCLYDGKPVPKVIDFGLAKAMHQPLTEHTLHTAHGVMMGTPLYMSPEQAEFNNLDVDTRTDVYALGVILYELLTGTTPLEKQRFKEAAWQEMLRLIKEEEPQRPSARLSGSVSLPALAAQRQLEPVKLTRLVRGELDWIVLKCLEKDRARRYDTANGLARDVERYLADELVEARPPTAWYRLRKFGRKHRGMLTTAAAFALLLIGAACVSSWLAMKANRAETTAEAKRHEAEVNAKEADANAKEARKNSEWAQANSDAWGKTAQELEKAMVDSQIRILGLQVDLDLAEVRIDPRTGLLRLARPLKDTWETKQYGPNYEGGGTATIRRDYAPLQELRQFVAAAVIATGQDYAPLLPPITHDGQPVTFVSLSPDNQTLLTLGRDYTARLWDARTARSIAVLRKGDERVVNCGFSPDGRTIFTDDLTSLARLWDAPGGRFRTAIDARQNRYDVSDWRLFGDNSIARNASQLSASRLLTRRCVGPNTDRWEGPAELWDAATGRLVARLDAQGRNIDKFQFLGTRWVATVEGNTLLLLSAEDGRLLARLNHPAGEVIEQVDVGPSGRRVATLARMGKDLNENSLALRVWDAKTWQAEPVATQLARHGSFGGFRFWMDDLSEGRESIVALAHNEQGSAPDGWTVYRSGQSEPIVELSGNPSWPNLLARVGGLAHGGHGQVYDTQTWRRLIPPPGRKFHPDLARFAPDGRFVRAVVSGDLVLIDTRTDKFFPMQGNWGNLPKFGMIAAMTSDYETTIRLIPPPSQVDFPAELLELWAQVTVCGELGDDGQFVPWDESKWEKKRQELAARPAPCPCFPFPGNVAADRLHWLRTKYASANDADKPVLARQLLERAEAIGDKAEGVRWGAVVGTDARRPPQAPAK